MRAFRATGSRGWHGLQDMACGAKRRLCGAQGIPRYTRVFHGIPWYPMRQGPADGNLTLRTRTWYTMVYQGYHGIPWYSMVYHGIPRVPWYSMVCHGTPWVPWYAMVCHGLPWHPPRNPRFRPRNPRSGNSLLLLLATKSLCKTPQVFMH